VLKREYIETLKGKRIKVIDVYGGNFGVIPGMNLMGTLH